MKKSHFCVIFKTIFLKGENNVQKLKKLFSLAVAKTSDANENTIEVSFSKEHACIVYQEGAFLVDKNNCKYDLFDLPKNQKFWIEGALLMDGIELEQLPNGLENCVVDGDFYIIYNPLKTLKNFPNVLGDTHINPIFRECDDPQNAPNVFPMDLFDDGTLLNLMSGKDVFMSNIEVLYRKPEQKRYIASVHEVLLAHQQKYTECLGTLNKTQKIGKNRLNQPQNEPKTKE